MWFPETVKGAIHTSPRLSMAYFRPEGEEKSAFKNKVAYIV